MRTYIEAMKLNCPCCQHRLDPPGTHGRLLCNAVGHCPKCKKYWNEEESASETKLTCDKHRRIKKGD